MKRLLCIFIFAALALSGCGGAKTERTAMFVPTENSAIVLSIFAFNGDSESVFAIVNMGHSFISVLNNSGKSLKIGELTLNDGESCTVGTWGMSTHFGVWYNVESEYIAKLNRYKGRVSLSMEITEKDLQKVNEFIKSNDTWKFNKNCSVFTTNLWNTLSKNTLELSGTVTPQILRKEIMRFKSFKTDYAVNNYGKIGHAKTGVFDEYTLVA